LYQWSLSIISAVTVRAKYAQAIAGNNSLARKFLGELESGALASGWDHLFSLVSIFLLGALVSLGYWIATKILFLVKVKVLGGWLRPVVG
jgi:hypothetical protein